MTLYVRQQKRHRCKEQDFWILWEKVRVGWFERIALKHIYYHMWNRSPVLVRCMRLGAQGWCTGMTLWDGWGGRCEGVSGWRTHVHPWLIHVNVWQKPPQYYKVISLQLKLITEKARVGWSERIALKNVYYHMWTRMPIQVWYMRLGAQGWCTGMTQRDGMGTEVGEGSRMGNTCTPMTDSCQCMAKQHYNIVK